MKTKHVFRDGQWRAVVPFTPPSPMASETPAEFLVRLAKAFADWTNADGTEAERETVARQLHAGDVFRIKRFDSPTERRTLVSISHDVTVVSLSFHLGASQGISTTRIPADEPVVIVERPAEASRAICTCGDPSDVGAHHNPPIPCEIAPDDVEDAARWLWQRGKTAQPSTWFMDAPEPAPAPDRVAQAMEVRVEGDGVDQTLKSYLAAVLTATWMEDSAPRSVFGSDWQGIVQVALIRAGIVAGRLESDQWIEEIDQNDCDALVRQVIERIFS